MDWAESKIIWTLCQVSSKKAKIPEIWLQELLSTSYLPSPAQMYLKGIVLSEWS